MTCPRLHPYETQPTAMDCVKLKRQFEAAVQVIQNLPKDGEFHQQS